MNVREIKDRFDKANLILKELGKILHLVLFEATIIYLAVAGLIHLVTR